MNSKQKTGVSLLILCALALGALGRLLYEIVTGASMGPYYWGATIVAIIIIGALFAKFSKEELQSPQAE